MNIQNNGINAQRLSFGAHSKASDKQGNLKHNFYYLYDLNKYKCELEIYTIAKDSNGNVTKNKLIDSLAMPDGRVTVDMSDYPQARDGFAYRYKLIDKKNEKNISYAFDNGNVAGIFTDSSDDKYNIVFNNGAIINKNGTMQLIMPDIYYPGMVGVKGKPVLNKALREETINSVRTHANKLGGNFYGIIARLPQLEEEGVKRIVGTPYTKDQISSHKYWTENAYQISPDFGTEDDFKLFQIELFKHNINWIADAALVNEGLQGIHLAELLRKGSDSYSKNMFRASEKISLGILPDNCKYTRMKLINPPFTLKNGVYSSSNREYDPKKPTYIQFYDDRLADENQKKSNQPKDLVTYKHKNTNNIFEITHHDDAVYPFALEVSPYELQRNVSILARRNNKKVDLSDINTIKEIADFTNFKVVEKSNAGGLEVWDGNVDIAKVLFYMSAKDDYRFMNLPQYERRQAINDMYKGTLAVRDYALNSGKYWTKLPSDTLIEYIADKLKEARNGSSDYTTAINELVKKGDLPKSVLETVDKEVINNIVNDNYLSIILDKADERAEINQTGFMNIYSLSDYILRHSMDMPLETLPVGNNLLGVITSPYLAKKANTEDELGVSRFDLHKAGNPNLPQKYKKVYEQMESFYNNSVVPMIKKMVSSIGNLENDGEITPYGKYVLNEVTPELTKYIFIKALKPDAQIKFIEEGPLKGQLDFTNVNADEITLQSLGISYNGNTLEEEASKVLNILRKGINNIKPEDIQKIQAKLGERFKDVTENDFKIAEAIVDRTEAGLGWRIDASKDVAPIDSVRAGYDSMASAWDKVIDFWKKYNQEVLAINPHAYTTAEITDLAGLFQGQDRSKYKSSGDAERKFLNETGITTIANYNYFFSQIPAMFSKYSFEDGTERDSWQAKQDKNGKLREKYTIGWEKKYEDNPGFLFQSSDDGVANSYTFVGNHDKPRILHCLGLDMNLFFSRFTTEEDKQKALKCLRKKDVNYAKVKPAAIAMGTRLNECFDEVVKDAQLKNLIEVAISHLADGNFKGKGFDAEAFGTRPYDVAIKAVLDEVQFISTVKIPDREAIEAAVLEKMLAPAIDRYLSMYKLLITTPGSPTEFAGDRVGSTGFETKAKNYFQQNRNIIHWEWLNDPKYSYIKKFYDSVNELSSLRYKKELSALNNGAAVSIPISRLDNGKYRAHDNIQALLRYNNEGSVVITLHDNKGASVPYSSKINRQDDSLSYEKDSLVGKLVFDYKNLVGEENVRNGLKHGLTVGTRFKNYNSNDKNLYEVAKTIEDGKEYYYLKCTDASGKEIPITIKPEDLNTLILYKVN